MSSGQSRCIPITRCPQCGGEPLVWPSPKHFECGGCGFTLYLNCAAAVAVILECQGEILFGVRKHEPEQGKLDLPGGFVDPGETVEDAARRELKEELGIDLPSLSYLFSFPNTYLYRGIEYDTLDLIFLAQFDRKPEIRPADDLEDALWISRDQIEYEKIGFPSIRRAIRRYLG